MRSAWAHSKYLKMQFPASVLSCGLVISLHLLNAITRSSFPSPHWLLFRLHRSLVGKTLFSQPPALVHGAVLSAPTETSHPALTKLACIHVSP